MPLELKDNSFTSPTFPMTSLELFVITPLLLAFPRIIPPQPFTVLSVLSVTVAPNSVYCAPNLIL